MQPLMFDCSRDVRPLIGHLGLTGCVAVGRPLFAGATDATGAVPLPVAVPLAQGELPVIAGAGLAVLPYANNLGWGDLSNPATVAQKVQAAIDQAHALGFPAGSYLAVDLENWPCPPASLAAICGTIRASDLGGSGMPYLGADSPAVAVWRQLRATNADVARALLWVARYPGTLGSTPPAWAPGVDDPAVAAWQYTDRGVGAVDVSILRLPLLTVGTTAEGLLLSDGAVGSPRTPGVTAALAHLAAARAALEG